MSLSNKKYRDDPNRLQSHDYSAPGKYFLTICTQNREYLFGEVENGVMNLSEYGKIVADEIVKILRIGNKMTGFSWNIKE